MNRRQLAFIILINAIVTVLVSSCVVWVVERRRPDPEELAAVFTPQAQAIAAVTTIAIRGSDAGDSAPETTSSTAQTVELAPNTSQGTTNNAASTSNASGSDIYIVQSGDSLTGIANQFGLTIDQLLNINNLDNPDFVFVGQRLILPTGTVARGSAQTSARQPTSSNQPSRAVNGQMQITTVSDVGALDSEMALVVNESDAAFNLQGWTLGREGGPIYTFGNLPIFPGGSVRIHSKSGTDTSVDLFWRQPGPVWTAGSVARLVNVQGELVHTFTVQ